jgi:lysophospholipase L1-like esterase
MEWVDRFSNKVFAVLLSAMVAFAPAAARADASLPPIPIPITSNYLALPILPNGTKLLLLGTSITANSDFDAVQNSYSGGQFTQATCGTQCWSYYAGGFGSWLSLYTNNRVNRAPGTNNFGVVGETVVDMATPGWLNKLLAAVVPGQTITVVQGGDNDIEANASCTTIETSLRTIYTALQAKGSIVIRPTIYPRGGSAAWNTSQYQVAACVNQSDLRFAQESGNGRGSFYVVNMDAVIGDPSQTTATPRSGYLLDGVHPSVVGASAYAYAVAQVINQLIPNWRIPVANCSDVFNSTYNPAGNFLTNGCMAGGSSGSLGGAAAGVVATGWNLFVPSISGLTVTGAVPQVSDGSLPAGSYYQSITLSGTYTYAGVNGLQAANFYQTMSTSDFTSGEIVEGCAFVRIKNNTNMIGAAIEYSATENANSVIQYSGQPAAGDGSFAMASAGFADGAFHEICTPPHTVATPISSPTLQISLWLTNQSGSATAAGEMDVAGIYFKPVIP